MTFDMVSASNIWFYFIFLAYNISLNLHSEGLGTNPSESYSSIYFPLLQIINWNIDPYNFKLQINIGSLDHSALHDSKKTVTFGECQC